jgi:dihydrofolate reductase
MEPRIGRARRLRLFVASSLDAYLARRDERLDWLFTDADYGYTDFYASVDTLIVGRRTYDVCLTFDVYPYAGKRVLVMSKSRNGVDQNGAEYTAEEPFELLHRLRATPGADLWLVGGGQTVRSFLAANLVDDIDLFVHPILLGDGRPLFPAGFPETKLRLASTEAYPSGLVRLSYERP